MENLEIWVLWNVAHFALLIVAIALTWIAWRRLGPAFGIYSVGVLVISLERAGRLRTALFSLPRFLLADFPIVIALAGLLEE